MFSLSGLILCNKVEVVIKLNLCNSCISLTEGHQMLCVSRDAQHCLDNPVIRCTYLLSKGELIMKVKRSSSFKS